MKKVLVIALCGAMLLMNLVGCGIKECDFCGEKGMCKTKTVFGTEINYCGDCEDSIRGMF